MATVNTNSARLIELYREATNAVHFTLTTNGTKWIEVEGNVAELPSTTFFQSAGSLSLTADKSRYRDFFTEEQLIVALEDMRKYRAEMRELEQRNRVAEKYPCACCATVSTWRAE